MDLEPARSFDQLVVWQKAHLLTLRVYEVTRKFPKEELFGLTSQMRRAAISVPANIAEGFSKKGKPDKLRIFNIAQASLEELRYFFILGRDLRYLPETENWNDLTEVGRLLGAYVSRISRDSSR